MKRSVAAKIDARDESTAFVGEAGSEDERAEEEGDADEDKEKEGEVVDAENAGGPEMDVNVEADVGAEEDATDVVVMAVVMSQIAICPSIDDVVKMFCADGCHLT